MSDYNERMLDILMQDFERWQSRENAKRDGIQNPQRRYDPRDGAYVNPELTRGMGTINPPAKYPHAKPRTRVSGVAVSSDNPEHIARLAAGDVNSSVRVIHADGREEIRPQSDFRRSRETTSRARTTPVATPPECATIALQHDYNQG